MAGAVAGAAEGGMGLETAGTGTELSTAESVAGAGTESEGQKGLLSGVPLGRVLMNRSLSSTGAHQGGQTARP